jgi:hypothetical protein
LPPGTDVFFAPHLYGDGHSPLMAGSEILCHDCVKDVFATAEMNWPVALNILSIYVM